MKRQLKQSNCSKSAKSCFVIGTRAQLIKTAPVMRELQRRNLPYFFLYTAQHRETISNTIVEFGLKQPDRTLVDWNEEAKTIALFSSWLLKAFLALSKARNLVPFTNGVVVVHGDTASTLWGALLGKLSGNRVMHLESGLRSFNIFHPFPEELIRILTFRLSDIYVCPGEWAVENLSRYKGVKLNTLDNTIIDSLRFAIESQSLPPHEIGYVVFSIHRFENLFNDARLKLLVNTVKDLSERFSVKFVLHPSTSNQLAKKGLFGQLDNNQNIELMDRLSYADFMNLVVHAAFVVTDGGSNQEELSYLGVPTLIFRQATERQEGMGLNAVLSGYDTDVIRHFIDNYQDYRQEPLSVSRSPSSIVADWLEANL